MATVLNTKLGRLVFLSVSESAKPKLCCAYNSNLQPGTAVFWQKNRKGTDDEPPSLYSRAQWMVQNVVPETKKLLLEQKEAYEQNPVIEVDHGNYEVFQRFNTKAEVDKWVVTSDSDNQGGKSTANFTFTKNSTGLFHGHISKMVPKDGKTKYAGYANITCLKPMKSFRRIDNWDWSHFNCLTLRIRGDGRAYMVVMGANFYYDVNWLNRWSCPLFTRGGPYWQHVKIPFSKFFVSHSGRIQDKQEMPPLSIINSFGITCGDWGEGPFYLEIDSIALLNDINQSGKHAYEQYEDKNFEMQN